MKPLFLIRPEPGWSVSAETARAMGLDVHGALTDDARCTDALTTAHALGEELERVATRNAWRG